MAFCGMSFGAMSAGFRADGVTFDTSTYLTRGGGFTGAADGKEFTFSGWVKTDGTEVIYLLNAGTGNFFEVRCQLRNVAVTTLNTSSSQNIVAVTTGNPLSTTEWNHIAISVDLTSSSNRHIYVNRSAATVNWSVYNNSNIDMTRTDWQVNASDSSGGSAKDCDMAEIYLVQSYLDISDSGNLAKFVNGNNNPVDLGNSGEKPTGSAALVYLSKRDSDLASEFASNRGTGGGMTENGTLTASATSPSS